MDDRDGQSVAIKQALRSIKAKTLNGFRAECGNRALEGVAQLCWWKLLMVIEPIVNTLIYAWKIGHTVSVT